MKKILFVCIPIIVATTLFFIFRTNTDDYEIEKDAAIETKAPDARISPVNPQKKNERIASHAKVDPQFQALVEHTFEVLPTIAALKNHPDHSYAPPELLKAGTSFGQIEDALKVDPSLVPQAIAFYRACAQEEKFLFAIRALCFRDLKYWSSTIPDSDPVEESQYPKDIVRAAGSIPSPRLEN